MQPRTHSLEMSGVLLTPTLCATASPSARLMARPGTHALATHTRAGPRDRPARSVMLRSMGGWVMGGKAGGGVGRGGWCGESGWVGHGGAGCMGAHLAPTPLTPPASTHLT